MTEIYVSVGSNLRREKNVRWAISQLGAQYGTLRLSSVYDSAAVGFVGVPFLNLVVAFQSIDSATDIHQYLIHMEDQRGRDRSLPKFSDRNLDLDLLLYGNQIIKSGSLFLPRAEIIKHAFVLAPLAELAGDLTHPLEHQTYAQLWQNFQDDKQQLSAIPFEWE